MARNASGYEQLIVERLGRVTPLRVKSWLALDGASTKSSERSHIKSADPHLVVPS